MPLVKIEVSEGFDRSDLLKMRDSIMDSVVESLQLPPDDRNIRIIEYTQDFFAMKNPYKMLIEISLFLGRTKETKKRLFQTIVNNLESIGLIKKAEVFIILNEQPLANWGVRGGIPADEINLDFKVEI
jgi:phenylpyruvate tautomerase PptA (4-oxalocrotonate tautomerase family)